MQAVLEQKQSGLVFFARRRNRDYMMRSEKRPNYNRAQFDPGRNRRPKKRRRTSHAYLIFTFIISVLLWPLGLFLIWNRRMRCKAGGKLVWSLVTLILFSALIFALLTFPTRSEKFQAFQDDANDFFATVWADTRIVAETVADRTEDAWTNMRLFVDSAQAQRPGRRIGNVRGMDLRSAGDAFRPL